MSKQASSDPAAWYKPHWNGVSAEWRRGAQLADAVFPEMWKPLYEHSDEGRAHHDALLKICTALGMPAGGDMHVDGPALANSLRNLLHNQGKQLAERNEILLDCLTPIAAYSMILNHPNVREKEAETLAWIIRLAERLTAATSGKCSTCGDQGEVYSGRMAHQGYNQPPEPVMDACPDCAFGDIDELARLNAEIRRLELLAFGNGFHGPVECPTPQPLQRWRLEAGDGGLYTDNDQEGEWVAWEDAERLNRHLHAANVALKARAETFDLQKSLIDKGKSLLAKCLPAVREQHCDDGEADFDLPAPLTIEIDKYLSPIPGMDKRHDE